MRHPETGNARRPRGGTVGNRQKEDLSPSEAARREVLKYAGLGSGAAVAGLFANSPLAAEPLQQEVRAVADSRATGMPSPIIKDIVAIQAPPGGSNMVVK